MTSSANLPYPRSYWARPGKILAGCYPGAQDPVEAEAKLTGLMRSGVSRIVNLMEEVERNHDGQPLISAALSQVWAGPNN